MKASIKLWLFFIQLLNTYGVRFSNTLTAQTMSQFHRQSLTKLQGNALMLQIKGPMLGMADENDAI